MADGQSSASVVAVDPQRAARERDNAAREMLSENNSALSSKQYVNKGLALTVPYTLKVVYEDENLESVKNEMDKILSAAFQLADTVLNDFNPNSEVSLINKLPVGEAHQMSGALKRVMGCCQRVYNSSRGNFDPAAGPLVAAFREAARNGVPVPAEKVDRLYDICTLPKSFEVDLARGLISRKHSEAGLDLGAVSKGYIVDTVITRLTQAGLMNVFFEWGGDVRANGTNASGQPWTLGIMRPPSLDELGKEKREENFLRVVRLDNEAVATSGDYENLIHGGNGAWYSSTFDRSTRQLIQPSMTNFAQVSVKSYSCMYADALATACLTKKDPSQVRYMLDSWRYVRDKVTDYTLYTRQNERVARMYEIATEDASMREKRIAGSLPARVVIIGGGLAGCVAAIEAASCGAQVILMEKEAKIGGNSAKATSGMNGWGTRAQAQQGVVDAGKFFERDTYRSGVGGNCDPGLVRMLSVKSADAVKFICSTGVPLSVLSQLGGASRKRCHRAPDKSDGTPVPIGFTIMRTLEKHIRKSIPNIKILLNTTVLSLVHEKIPRPDYVKQMKVTGVVYSTRNSTPISLTADSVILATGGFSNDHTNRSLLQEFAPHLSSFPTTNGEWATGDGVKMARELGVELVDMDKVQLHPTGLIDPKNPSSRTKFLGPEALRGSGGVLLNKTGERFVNELDLRSVVSQAIIAQNNEYPGSGGSKFAYCVLNEAAAKLFGKNALSFYWKQLGLFVRVENTEELAKLIGCNVEVLKRTLAQYEQISSSKVQACHVTGKNVFPCVLGMQGPYYVAYVTPSIHYTMGGCLITPSAEMQTTDITNILSQRESRSVLGLFGAGEVTGGLHGMNRLGGNSLLECVVFGRIAGQRAGNSALLGHGVLFSSHEQSDANIAKVVLSVRAVQFVCNPCEVNEVGERDIVLNLASAYQLSGLAVLESVRLRSLSDPALPSVSLIPSSLPDDFGMLSFHLPARSDQTKAKWLYTLEPGTEVEVLLDKHSNDDVKCDVHVRERALMRLQQQCTRIVVVAGGECAVAATVQLIRVLVQFIRVHQVSMHARGQQQEQEAHALQLSSLHVVYLTEAQQSSYGEQLLSEMSKNAQNILSVQFVKMRSDRGEECKEELSHDEATVLRTALSPSKTSADDMGVIVVGAVENMQRVASHIQANDYIADKAFMLQYFVPHEGV